MKMSWSLADDVVVVVVAVVVGRGGRGAGGEELVEPPGQDGDCNHWLIVLIIIGEYNGDMAFDDDYQSSKESKFCG